MKHLLCNFKIYQIYKVTEGFKSVSAHGDRALLGQSFRVDIDRVLFSNQELNMNCKSNSRCVPNKKCHI